MEKIILIDAGHGGLYEGRYMTNGKQATFNQTTIYEGVLNRAVAHLLNYELSIRNIKSQVMNTSEIDINLSGRCFMINEKVNASPNKKFFLLSIHHNASSNQSAEGFECYTSKGETQSDIFANYLMKLFITKHPKRKARINTIEDPSKDSDFYILKNTICPAVLTEFAFMTNKKEFDYMTVYNGIQDEVNLLVEWIRFHVVKLEQ